MLSKKRVWFILFAKYLVFWSAFCPPTSERRQLIIKRRSAWCPVYWIFARKSNQSKSNPNPARILIWILKYFLCMDLDLDLI
jgi:hypothetical protein